ncbi:MAG: nucleotide exchange factor GrpE [Candidatus Woesearchaeota archaeon]
MNQNQKDFCQGVELIYAQLKSLLENNNVKEIEAKGKFDPYLHEALMKVPADLPEGEIIEEFQKGYMLHGQVIRHTKVKISAGKKKEEKKEN